MYIEDHEFMIKTFTFMPRKWTIQNLYLIILINLDELQSWVPGVYSPQTLQ